jgi:ribonuclease BN (tRNA processing enzyme)
MYSAWKYRLPPGTGHLVLTHLLPGTDHRAARAAASAEYDGDISVATADLVLDLS